MPAGGEEITRTLLGLKETDGTRKIIIWDTEDITVGRAPECDIIIDEEDVSRHHAILRRGVADFFVKDLGTPNGTLVNREPLLEEHTLALKDLIAIGETEITFIRTKKDPASLGVDVMYASQLKGFGGNAGVSANPYATTLALGDDFKPSGEFEVDAVGSYGYAGEEGNAPAVAAPPVVEEPIVDIDGDLVEEEMFELPDEIDFPDAEPRVEAAPILEAPPAPVPQPAAAAPQAGGAFTLQLELEGLSPDLQRVLSGMLGKEIVLPNLKVRIKGEDLG